MTVKVYSAPVCPWCSRAKDWLKEHNIKFQEINVAEDPKAAQEMMAKSGHMGVPQIDIDGEMVVGFNEEALKEKLLKKK